MTQTETPHQMQTPTTSKTSPTGTGEQALQALKRNAYWHGKLMGVSNFQLEQDYVRQLQQTITRLAVGCGVLCGLHVAPCGDKGMILSEGAAIDGAGRLILVTRDQEIGDLSTWMCAGGDLPPLPGRYEVCLFHHDCALDPAPALVTDCDTHVECRPGAYEERFRLEVRPTGDKRLCDDRCRHCQHRIEPGRACRCDHGDCVPIAHFHWDGQTVSALTVDHRSEIPSVQQLYELVDCGNGHDETAENASRLTSLWPAPGLTLDREGSPSDWARWRRRPRLEFTFDCWIAEDCIDDPDDWLRAWVVTGDGADRDCRRLTLRYLDDVHANVAGKHTIVYDLVDDASYYRAAPDSPPDFTVIVQAVANNNTGPAGANPVRTPAQIEFAGTTLSREQLDQLWSDDRFPTDHQDQLMATPQPECFGDGYDGGRLHAAFAVSAVTAEPHVTSVFPRNGSRSQGDWLPAVEISAAATLPEPVAIKAWLIDDDPAAAPTALTLSDPFEVPPEQAAARAGFEGAFDPTLIDEMAATICFGIEQPSSIPDGGRVLVIMPSLVTALEEARFVGAFAGTCLTETEVARIYDSGPSAADRQHIRPSPVRMPRASRAGKWIHWTFAWEQTR